MKYLLPLLFLQSCFSRSIEELPSNPPIDNWTIETIGNYGSLLGGALVLIGIICIIWVGRKTGISLITTGFSLIVGGVLLSWLGAILIPLCVILVILGLAYAYFKFKKNIPKIEKDLNIDINRDGVIG